MHREPSRGGSGSPLSLKCHAHPQQLVSRHCPPGVLSRGKTGWGEKDFCVVFVFQHRQLLPRGESSSSPLLPASVRHVQAGRLHGQTWPMRACERWCTLLTRLLSPGALVCFVTTEDVLHLLVCALICFSWSRGHSVTERNCCTVDVTCACCVVSLSRISAALNPERTNGHCYVFSSIIDVDWRREIALRETCVAHWSSCPW